MRHKALLLNLEGTLVRTDYLQMALWKEIFASYEIHLTQEEYEQRIAGRDDRIVWQEWGVGTQEEREAWTAWKQEAFLRRIHEIKSVPGGKERIQEWNDMGFGYWVGIVTKFNMVIADALLVHLGVVSLVDVVITSDSDCAPKPSPEPYQMALLELGVDPENAIIVERSAVGIESARRTGPAMLFRILPEYQLLPSEWGIISIRDLTDKRLTPSFL